MGGRFTSPLIAGVSGVLLYACAAAWKVFAMLVVPLLVELHETSPRLATLGWLVLFLSPAIFVAVLHRATHGVFDLFDSSKASRQRAPALESVWAGLLAWFTMSFAAMVSALTALALFPERAGDAGAGAMAETVRLLEDVSLVASVHTAIRIGVAAGVYYLERVTRGSGQSF